MQLRITHRGNELLTFPAEQSTQVTDVKSLIANSLGLSQSDIILTVNGAYLEDSRSLGEYDIKEFGSLQLHLPINSQKIVSVRVIISPEEVYSIPLRSHSTVAVLRSEIKKRVSTQSFDLQNAFLVYSHYILEDSRTLEEYGITDNAGITVAHTFSGEKQTPSEPYDYCSDFKDNSVFASGPRMISVHFLIEHGDPFTFMLDPTKPLRNASRSIELKTGIPSTYQDFIISGVKVDPEKTPQELKLEEGESLYLNDKRVREMYPSPPKNKNNEMVVIFDLGRHRIRMTVSRDCTVSEVIRALQTHDLLYGQKIDLFFHETRLDPRKRLHEYGIINESVVNVGTQFL
nr:polyubiquitin [Hymenolepis microstoma]